MKALHILLQVIDLPEWELVLAGLKAAAGPVLLALGVLVVLSLVDILSGVASALRRGAFVWERVNEFYAKTILPKVLGWLSLTLLTLGSALAVLPQEVAAWVGGGLAAVAYLVVLNDFRRSIFANLREVFGDELPALGGSPGSG